MSDIKVCKKCATPIPIDVCVINPGDFTKELKKIYEQARALAFLNALLAPSRKRRKEQADSYHTV